MGKCTKQHAGALNGNGNVTSNANGAAVPMEVNAPSDAMGANAAAVPMEVNAPAAVPMGANAAAVPMEVSAPANATGSRNQRGGSRRKHKTRRRKTKRRKMKSRRRGGCEGTACLSANSDKSLITY